MPGARAAAKRSATGAPSATVSLARRGPPGFLAWFHAASVGEANAALPVIETIAAERPEIRLLLTTATVTSARLARTRLPKGVLHQYVPLDNQVFVQRFLRHWRPDLAVLVESEIWPNLVLETKALDIPLLLINGRMSASSFKRWRRRPGLSRPLFSAFDLVLAQNDRLAERFAQLGVARALDVGNLKADAPPPPADLPGRRKLDAALAGRTVWLAASTHPGEDEIVTAAHLKMRIARPDLLTIIVPRHPERGPLIAEQLARGRPQGRAALGRRAARAATPTSTWPTPSASSACSMPSLRSPLSAARSSIAAGKTRSSRSSSAPPCSPVPTGRTSATPMASCCARAAANR